jgi:predicted aconitase
MGISEAFSEGQRRIIDAFKNMAVNPTCTCTPYLVGHVPEIRSQIAWAESSAVVYSNSAIGARTNRESGPTSLASAITGLAAFYGYRLEENRLPCKIVEIEADLRSSMDYSALGYLTGRMLGAAVPYYRGMKNPDLESIKALGAACATSGSIALFHGEGVTPEANMMSNHLRGLERVTVERVDLEEAIEELTCELNDPVYCLGCPHCSLKELEEVAKLVKREELNGRLWVFTSRGVYADAKQKKIVDVIEKAGGRVFRDTCMVVTPVKDLGWKEVATHSFKAAHYLSSMGLKTRLSTFSELVTEALI